MNDLYDETSRFIRDLYGSEGEIPLHAPRFDDREKAYLIECIDSTFVSSVGKFVDEFESRMRAFGGFAGAVAVVNGTCALHVALRLAGVAPGDEVLTQAATFVATCNAISYAGASPAFVDIDLDTLGMSPEKLDAFLSENAVVGADSRCRDKATGKRISCCVPMHTFGHPARIEEIASVCSRWNIELVEDCAESLGSTYKGRHTGHWGKAGILSFNGNKTITTGGGGMILSDDIEFCRKAKHLTTTAKVPHKWEFVHDKIGYNYRMPNINAALGCAQFEKLEVYLEDKRGIARAYDEFFSARGVKFVREPKDSRSNYWLCAVLLENRAERDGFLEAMNSEGISCRPLWRLMSRLDIFKECRKGDLANSEWIEDRLVNVPSGVRGRA